MFVVKLFRYWLTFLTFLMLVSPLTISKVYFLPALSIAWITYIFFKWGAGFSSLPVIKIKYRKELITSSYFSLLVAFLFCAFVPIYLKFYTGSSILELLRPAENDLSNYMKYQEYFKESELASFSMDKLPFIILYGFFKFASSLLMLRYLLSKSSFFSFDTLAFILFILCFLLISVGRGTSFELFEIILLCVFGYLLSLQIKNDKLRLSLKAVLIILFLGVLASFYFISHISTRFNLNLFTDSDYGIWLCSTDEFCVDTKSWLFRYFPVLSITLYQLAAYFLFGSFFVSSLLIELFSQGQEGIVSFLIPYGNDLIFATNYKEMICGKILDCGYAWIPDYVGLLSGVGIVVLFGLIYILGRFSNIITVRVYQRSLVDSILLYHVFFFLMSLFVGNFLSGSSSNQISLSISIGLYLIRKYKLFFFKKADLYF